MKYNPQKQEWGTDAATARAKEVTPGEKRKMKTFKEFDRSADKVPQNYRDPETGRTKVRMVPKDKEIIKKESNFDPKSMVTYQNMDNSPRARRNRTRNEATYQGKKVPLNKPMSGDVKKSKVYVDPDGDGKAKKVNFGDKNMTIKKNIPARRKSFRARHNCDNPGPKDKARYWSCKAW